VTPDETNVGYMRARFDEKQHEFAALGGDLELREAIERHVAARNHLLAGCRRPSLCHADCHYGDVLVRRPAVGR